jgi:DNA-binding CsgD family transcriptional regulator/tetratricopeptide (TPR) repeat protein
MLADADRPLGAADLERLAACAYLSGDVDGGLAAWERAYSSSVDDPVRAARCAFWLAFVLLNHDERARGGGWMHRGERLLDRARTDCVERGYLRYCAALSSALDGDVDHGEAGFAASAEVGERFGDMELVALGRVGQGRCLIRRGEAALGMALLDEAMALASVSAVSPTAMGDLYCTAIEGCHEVFDVRRAQEWTEALDRWCRAQPALVIYRGQCLVHRAELMLLAGTWSEALEEVHRAVARLSRPRSHPALGAAFYVRGDIQRLRGNYAEAERAFSQAGTWGRQPQPGLALLQLAQGRTAEAQSALRHALTAAGDPVERARLLGPFVDVALAAGDRPAARAAAEELATTARAWNTPVINAISAQALGTVLLAEGTLPAALGQLRRAWAGWRDLEAPHDAARVRALLGLTRRACGDEAGARTETDAARLELQRLGASPDVIRCLERAVTGHRPTVDGLTSREVQVLELVATGVTNRAIAAALVISERTVATHVGSILRKLSLPSRAAATRYAHLHHLL